MAAEFFILHIRGIGPLEMDLVTESVFAAGADGTEEDLSFEQLNLEYEARTLEKDKSNIKVYFTVPPSPQWIENFKNQFSSLNIFLEKEKDKDWLSEWKKGFEPFCLAKDIWIVPSWREIPRNVKSAIRMDPGMAFGTGTHETTRLAAEMMADQMSLQPPPNSLIDVGTGTAILAMLAEHLGVQRIYGNDIDPEARRVARENLELNHSRRVQITDLSISEIEGAWDWVVANIIDGVLIRLQDDLKAHVKDGGFLLLTGILSEREAYFLSEFSFVDFKVVKRKQLAEWVGYLLQRTKP